MAQKSGDCYIDVWREADFRGETMRIYGPAEYAALDFAQGDWGDDIGSLRVGLCWEWSRVCRRRLSLLPGAQGRGRSCRRGG